MFNINSALTDKVVSYRENNLDKFEDDLVNKQKIYCVDNILDVNMFRDNVLDEVKSYLDKCKRKNVLRDTIDVLEEFLRK